MSSVLFPGSLARGTTRARPKQRKRKKTHTHTRSKRKKTRNAKSPTQMKKRGAREKSCVSNASKVVSSHHVPEGWRFFRVPEVPPPPASGPDQGKYPHGERVTWRVSDTINRLMLVDPPSAFNGETFKSSSRRSARAGTILLVCPHSDPCQHNDLEYFQLQRTRSMPTKQASGQG